MSADSILSTFVANDGDNIVVQDWPLESHVALRGVVIVVHGLGEHAWRYDHVARKLNEWGFAVRSYDQCGHGESGGARGAIPTDTRLLDDLTDIVDSTRVRMEKGTPLILLGHSLGGLVVTRFVGLGTRPVDGVVLSSPLFDPGMNAFQKFVVAVLPKFAPNLRVGSGVKVQLICRDPAVVAAYRADPLVHDRISTRLARFISEVAPQNLAMASQWKVPTLLLYAGDDRLLNPQGSRSFAAAAPASVVQAVCFESFYHEVFSEPGAHQVFAAMQEWLNRKF